LHLPIAKAIINSMTLTEYLQSGRKTASELARELGIAPSMIYQYRMGLRTVPARRCPDIERATGGVVTRKDLRPHDWHEIWAELKEMA